MQRCAALPGVDLNDLLDERADADAGEEGEAQQVAEPLAEVLAVVFSEIEQQKQADGRQHRQQASL